MKLLSSLLLCVCLFAGTLNAETFATREESKGRGKVWWASVGAMIGASFFDAHSSWGRQELNPVLRGTNGEFGAKGIALKVGIASGVAIAQYFLLRKNPGAEKSMAIGNFGMAGVFGAIAVYNHTNSSIPTIPAPQPQAAQPQSRPSYLVATP